LNLENHPGQVIVEIKKAIDSFFIGWDLRLEFPGPKNSCSYPRFGEAEERVDQRSVVG